MSSASKNRRSPVIKEWVDGLAPAELRAMRIRFSIDPLVSDEGAREILVNPDEHFAKDVCSVSGCKAMDVLVTHPDSHREGAARRGLCVKHQHDSRGKAALTSAETLCCK